MKYYEAEMTTERPSTCLAMTWEDAEKMEKLNQECGWGFSTPDLLRFIADHMEAHDESEEETDPAKLNEHFRKMECIEWRLTDANFHTFCEMLKSQDYYKALNAIASGEY